MTKKAIKKAAYQHIYREGNSHQQAFEALKTENKSDLETLADEISKIPSKLLLQRFAVLRYLLMGIYILIVLLRAISILFSEKTQLLPLPVILLLIALGLLVPILGIYALLVGKTELVRTTGILLALALLRSFQYLTNADTLSIVLTVVIYSIAIGLSFYLFQKLKTPYTTHTERIELDGKRKTLTHYVFDSAKPNNSELLDSDF